MTILDQSSDEIRTARLTLRPLREADADRLFALISNWDVIRWLSVPPWPYLAEHARDFIAARKVQHPDFITAAIALDDRLIGVIDAAIKPESAVQRRRGYALGYWLGQPYWGQGYMSEAARGFVGQVFAIIADDAIYSGAHNGNIASLRIQDRLGFTRVGEAMSFSVPNGRELPHVNTVLTRARFKAAG